MKQKLLEDEVIIDGGLLKFSTLGCPSLSTASNQQALEQKCVEQLSASFSDPDNHQSWLFSQVPGATSQRLQGLDLGIQTVCKPWSKAGPGGSCTTLEIGALDWAEPFSWHALVWGKGAQSKTLEWF